ncbi:MAG: hypothetical protein HYV03_03400 [Deltaproteobacteria bacterium]|nr:hypothetical protein [Deltaproteobacteria bacterium]
MRTGCAQRGMSILGAVIALMAIGVMGVTAAAVLSTQQGSRSAMLERQAAGMLAQAGLEYGLMQITQGGYPNATKSLGMGTFTVEVLPTQHIVRSIGVAGQATQEYRITDNFLGGDCVTVNNLTATLTGPQKDKLHGITLVKTCLNQITIDKWIMTWSPTNANEKVIRIELPTPNNVIWDDSGGVSSGGLIDSTNYTMTDQITQVHEIRFAQNMACKTFSMQVFFTDGSSAVMPQTLLGTGQCLPAP